MKTINIIIILFFYIIIVVNALVPEHHLELSHNDLSIKELYDIGIYPTRNNQVFVTSAQLKTLDNANITYKHVWEKRSTTDQHGYHNYIQLTKFLIQQSASHSKLAKTFVIGQSVEHRDLIGIRLTNFNTLSNDPLRPSFKYVGNMHGDETVGREMLVRLIDYLLSQYKRGNVRIQTLLDTVDIWILPSMNPDGFEHNRRTNANGVDLNRNFPDRIMGNMGRTQPEVQAIKVWSRVNHFVLSANLHGGDLVANYPYDGNRQHQSGKYARTADDRLFKHLAFSYSVAHTKMHNSYQFPNGITNGAHWYVLYGGMQDWNYEHTSCLELTMELSHTKYPPSGVLDNYWNDNKNALITYIEQIHLGVKGQITNSSGQGIDGATIVVKEIGHTVMSNHQGYYWRLLLPGTYHINVKHPQYTTSEWKEIVIPRQQEINFILKYVVDVWHLGHMLLLAFAVFRVLLTLQ
jgi:carboxypeptidase D